EQHDRSAYTGDDSQRCHGCNPSYCCRVSNRFFFFSSRRRHTRSVSAFLLNRSSDLQGDVLATDNNTVGMGDAGIKSAIQGSNVPNPDEAVPSFVSGAMAKAGKGLLEGTLQAGTSAVSDKLLDLVGLGGKSAAD